MLFYPGSFFVTSCKKNFTTNEEGNFMLLYPFISKKIYFLLTKKGNKHGYYNTSNSKKQRI
jgi:hypothetical protein